ncbi:MAG: hypothetical protein RIF33_16720 [Cyclobacteriaceae bacterium]
MVRLGSLCALLFLLGGCLEQDLDVLNTTEAERLLSASSDKTWVTQDAAYQLEIQQSTSNSFLLINADGDSVSYGTWSVTEDVRGNFTDSLLFDLTEVDVSNPLSEITIIPLLTSDLLDLESDDQFLKFSCPDE